MVTRFDLAGPLQFNTAVFDFSIDAILMIMIGSIESRVTSRANTACLDLRLQPGS